MKLSISIPSNRQLKCRNFVESLVDHSYNPEIEIIISPEFSDSYYDNLQIYYQEVTLVPHKPKTTVSDIHELCYKHSKGDWILFANDDIICETSYWSELIFNYIDSHTDPVLFWPDDKIFGARLSCFPLVSRRVIEAINYFPLPYARYRMDDTLFDVFPPERRVFMPDVIFRHLNVSFDPNVHGFPVPNGGIYPNLEPYMTDDTKLYRELKGRRDEQRKIIESMIHL